jgi:hypothetical protein
MIVSLVKGGLGNMMFQIAAGASLANEIGTEFSYSYLNWHCCTPYKIDHYPNTIFSNINKTESCGQLSNLQVFKERTTLYNPIPKLSNLMLDGYFQSERYFNTELVKTLFNIPTQPKYKDYTFIHIRRGDYIKYSNIHTVLPISYYESAMKILNPNKVIILTDDIEWAKTHTLFSEYEISNSKSDIEDLSIMRSCNSGIIANSTFSWWGAWLTNSSNIVAPNKWFANGTQIQIVTDRWICI